jgi:two-component system OmpR family sensor kinase
MVLALVLVFVLGSIATLANTRNQLIEDIDKGLADDLDVTMQLYNSFGLDEIGRLDAFENLDVVNTPIATVLVDSPTGQVLLEVPAGPVNDPLPRPDLSTDRIVDGAGTQFTVDGTDDGPEYRVTVGRLDDGRFLALAVPLGDVGNTISGLSRTLLATLVAMVTVLSVIIFFLQRASFRPYDELIDTAESIADGDMDRRAVQTTSDPEIRGLTDSLNTMLDRLQQSFEQRQAAEDRVKKFAADASHELRTPLTAILGYSEMYLAGTAPDEESKRKQIDRIHSEANRMSRLVNDLLTVARLDDDITIDARPIDLNALVAEAVADAEVIDPTHPIRYRPMLAADVEVAGDPDALQQVFANLLTNARLHAPGADVHIGIDRPDDRSAVVTLSDNGPGMSPEVAAHVFDRFFRADSTRLSSVRSSGLGLSIVAAIVAAHGGTIDLDTALGSGSTFTIALPLKHSPHARTTN